MRTLNWKRRHPKSLPWTYDEMDPITSTDISLLNNLMGTLWKHLGDRKERRRQKNKTFEEACLQRKWSAYCVLFVHIVFFGHIVLWIYFDEHIVAKTITITDNHGAMDRTQSRRNHVAHIARNIFFSAWETSCTWWGFLGNTFDSNMDGTMFAPYLR